MVIKIGWAITIGILISSFLIIGNGIYVLGKSGDFTWSVSGNSINTIVNNFYNNSSINQRMFILSQFLLLVVIVVVVVVVVRKFKAKALSGKRDYINANKSISKTDLDVLYEILRKEKKISITDVEKIFKVTQDVSMGWAKVLEDGNLAIVEYPQFGKPIIRLLTENDMNTVDACGNYIIGKEAPCKNNVKIGNKNICKIDNEINKINNEINKIKLGTKRGLKKNKKLKNKK